ncbi:MAG: CpsD/CapB family tyrosine-protein kinase, partial [Candidatus Thiodiazotropha sp. (ex Lucinoma borealis)]|nr:CpsD/CapB family tyrosine-protein kinase [Candidatus Thiodiazotropha sp. (ex Lucinoma borealis)]
RKARWVYSLASRLPGTNRLGFQPSMALSERVILGDTNDSISDQYKVLRTHVLQRLKANQWNSLAVTSPNEGCGKTLTSINLAISLAREVNHSVLLVDMDLRRPSIQHYFFKEEQPGISEYLTEGMELSNILFNPSLERLVILPGNKPFANSSEMLSSPKMVQLVEDLKNRYPNRMVIFDMPPVLSCDDVIAFSPYIDAVMLVIEEGVTRKDEIKRTFELLGDSNILGTVLNKSKGNELAYGSYY